MQLNERQLATVLAALRYFQYEMEEDEDNYGIIDNAHFSEFPPLSSDEIDELCAQLNNGAETIKPLTDKQAVEISIEPRHKLFALVEDGTALAETVLTAQEFESDEYRQGMFNRRRAAQAGNIKHLYWTEVTENEACWPVVEISEVSVGTKYENGKDWRVRALEVVGPDFELDVDCLFELEYDRRGHVYQENLVDIDTPAGLTLSSAIMLQEALYQYLSKSPITHGLELLSRCS